MKEKKETLSSLKRIYERYVVGAMSHMALGLFASLIIGVVFTQLAKIPGLGFLSELAAITQDKYVIGAAIGVAMANGFKSRPLVMFSCAVVGAYGYMLGGPLGAFAAVLVGAEIGGLIAGKTPFDIVLSPFITILAGGLFALPVSPFLGRVTVWLGNAVNHWATLQPFAAGVLIAAVVGMTLTSPISSAGLCASIGISGIASGAALVGCTAQMIGFAAASYKDNTIGGVISQALGTSKLQLPNVLRHPQIILAPTLAGAILGPITTCLLQFETSTSAAAGMGSCGLVGVISVFDKIGYTPKNIIAVLLVCFIAPVILSLGFHLLFKKIGFVKDGWQKLEV